MSKGFSKSLIITGEWRLTIVATIIIGRRICDGRDRFMSRNGLLQTDNDE